MLLLCLKQAAGIDIAAVHLLLTIGLVLVIGAQGAQHLHDVLLLLSMVMVQ